MPGPQAATSALAKSLGGVVSPVIGMLSKGRGFEFPRDSRSVCFRRVISDSAGHAGRSSDCRPRQAGRQQETTDRV
jgi:hypothetical protein